MPKKKTGPELERLEVLEGGIGDLNRSLTALEKVVAELALQRRPEFSRKWA